MDKPLSANEIRLDEMRCPGETSGEDTNDNSRETEMMTAREELSSATSSLDESWWENLTLPSESPVCETTYHTALDYLTSPLLGFEDEVWWDELEDPSEEAAAERYRKLRRRCCVVMIFLVVIGIILIIGAFAAGAGLQHAVNIF